MKTFRCFAYFSIILSLICVNTQTFAAVIHVPADHPTIQSGIDAAKDGDTVLVADGIYRGEGNVNIDFKGKQITVKSQNGAEATTIDCGRNPETRGFIFQNKETNATVLDGFTIKNGRHEFGGGIFCNNASPTIQNCTISWNKAVENDHGTGHGGGIYCFNSEAKIIDSKISNNIAESTHGGGIYFEGNKDKDIVFRVNSYEPNLISCTISENAGSGVISVQSVKTVIKDSEVSKNSGRGIVCTFFSRGGMQISNCLISQNTGGGVEVSEFSIVKITDSIIRQNTAKNGGGIFCSPSATVEISNCIIAQNIATRWGGGIGVFDSRWGSGVEIFHCTITRNSASESGGGIYVYSHISFRLTGSIVWGNNSDKTHDEIFVIGEGIVIKSNDIKDGLDGIGQEPDGALFIYEDNIDADPLFVDIDRGNYRLKENSPAAAMGADASLVGPLNVTSVGKKLVKWAELKRN